MEIEKNPIYLLQVEIWYASRSSSYQKNQTTFKSRCQVPNSDYEKFVKNGMLGTSPMKAEVLVWDFAEIEKAWLK